MNATAVRKSVSPGTTWDVTNHYITREDHPCFGTRRRTVTRTTSGRFYYVDKDGDEGCIEWPKAFQIRPMPDGSIQLFGGGCSQKPTDLFVTLRPVTAGQ